MGAESLDENTQNAQKMFGPICLTNPKSLEFLKKTLWMSVVRARKATRDRLQKLFF